MRVGSVHKKQPHASHWHRISAQSITADVVNAAILRFLSAQRREAVLAKEQATSTGEIGRQYQRVKQHRRVSDSSAYYSCTPTCCVSLRKSLPFSSVLYMA